ncbi:MAG: phosphatidylserine/phosphatidylglycerophosphate/cardiolipin synthase family protein [Sphaerochaetaceae bacterium]|nr:phosphatidylserine/phosphatidylglycerophosphate/cardiolipin synthase family protein [Sphaerochaetaceae bacterium]
MNLHRVSSFFLIIFLFLFFSCSTVGNLESESEHFDDIDTFLSEKGYPSFTTTLPDFYYTGESWKKASLDLIDKAQKSILVSTFLGVDDVSTEEIWQALADKAASGVKVYILIDSSSNFQPAPMTLDFVQAAYVHLKDLELKFAEYNPLSMSNLFFIPALLDRDHRKYWVFDSETVAVGGINVNHTSLNYPENLGNTDIMGVVKSADLARYITKIFIDTYNRYSAEYLSLSDFPYVDNEFNDTRSVSTAFAIDHYWQDGLAVKDLFDAFALSVEDELWMVQGYTFLTPQLIDRIQYITDKGVKVNFILSKNATQEKYELASMYSVADLLETGATVYLYDSPEKAFLHQKVVVGDKRYVTFGSANYNFRSHTLSRELNLVYDDERIAADLLSFIDTLVDHSVKMDIEEAQQFKTFRAWVNHVIMQVWG